MNGLTLFLAPLLAVAIILAPIISVINGKIMGKKAKTRLIANLCLFGAVAICCFTFSAGGLVTALADGASVAEAVSVVGTNAQGLGFLAAALAVGLGSIGAGIAVAAAAPAAIGAFSEDPKAFGKALIFVALGEGVAIYGLLIAILIINKL